MSDWDADDFEPEVASLAPPPAPVVEPIVQPTSKPAPLKKKEINLESLDRELTAAEREEIQKRSDMKMAKEMFGIDEEDGKFEVSFDDILTKEEFEEWGTKVGSFLAKRHKATHYGHLVNKLIIAVSDKLEPVEIRKISAHLTALANAKKTEGPKRKPVAGGKNSKPSLIVTKKDVVGLEDYDQVSSGKYDDDFDDFM